MSLTTEDLARMISTAILRLLKCCNCVLARHGRKFIQELRQRFPTFQVVEQGLKQDASAAKDRLATKNVRVFNDDAHLPRPPKSLSRSASEVGTEISLFIKPKPTVGRKFWLVRTTQGTISGIRGTAMYDYIIVGAGSAGCVLASRLTEDPNIKVLLLEAGEKDSHRDIHMPVAFSKLFKTARDWAYYTEPEAQLANRNLYWPRGKMLGGSSYMNAMIYIRGHRHDYDQWRDLGNPGWGYADVLPYFKKSEDNERGASEYHGAGGPLHVAELRSINPLSEVFVEAAEQAGFKPNPDFNGATQDGFGAYQVTQRDGRRHSAAAACLHPAISRANLTALTGVQETGILLKVTLATALSFQQ